MVRWTTFVEHLHSTDVIVVIVICLQLWILNGFTRLYLRLTVLWNITKLDIDTIVVLASLQTLAIQLTLASLSHIRITLISSNLSGSLRFFLQLLLLALIISSWLLRIIMFFRLLFSFWLLLMGNTINLYRFDLRFSYQFFFLFIKDI